VRSGPLFARIGGVLVLALAVMLTVRCTRELNPVRGEGGLTLTWKVDPGVPVAAADSARTWVLDGQDRILVGPVVAPFEAATGTFDLSLRVPAGEDRAVRMRLEGAGARGRGVVAQGEARGIAVPAAGAVEAHLRLRNSVPRLEPFTGQPGDLKITLRWSSVPGALRYLLYRRPPTGSEQTTEVPDTVRVFEPPYPAGFRENSGAGSQFGGAIKMRGWSQPDARRRCDRAVERVLRDPATLDTTWFRVSALLPGDANATSYRDAVSVASDSVAVLFRWVDDTPHVLWVVPAAEAIGVPDSVTVEIQFDRPMVTRTLGDVSVPSDTSHVTLRLDGTTDFVGLAVDPSSWLPDSSRVRLQPLTPLRRDARYLLRVTPGLRDRDGRPLDESRTEAGLQGFESRFDTERYDPLRVTGAVPRDGAAGVERNQTIEVELNRSARPATVRAGTVFLADSAGAAVACTVTQPEGRRISVVPDALLRYGTRYQLTVTTEVRDLRGRLGEPLDQDPALAGAQPFVLSFRTMPQPSGPRVIAVTPADGARGVPLSQEVRIHFSRSVRVDTVTGHFTVLTPGLATIQGVVAPASADYTEFTFTPAQLLEPGFLYTVVASGGMNPQGIPEGIQDNSGVPFDQDSTRAGYQEFRSTFRAERTPRVDSMRPRPGGEGVPVDTLIELRFSWPMDRASVTTANLALFAGANPVPVQPPEWSGDGKLVRLRPVAPLDWFRTYAVVADTSLRSADGSRFDQNPESSGYQPFRAEFLTAPDGISPRVASWTPGDGATGVPVVTPVLVRFTKPVVRASVLNADNFFVRKKLPASPRLEATRAITLDSLEATLFPAAPLENDVEYEVTVTKFVEDRSGQQLDQDSVAAFNQDFTGTFRTAIEHEPPRVIGSAPADGDTAVEVTIHPAVTFSEPMTLAGLRDAFSLSGPDGLVAGEIHPSSDGRRLEFTPEAPLRWSVVFHVRVDTAAADLAANRLDQRPDLAGRQPFESSFTTVPDRVPPRVISSVPADGDTAVEVTVHPQVTFDEVMDHSTLFAGLRLLDSLRTPVPLADPVVADDRRSAILVPVDSLRFAASYTLEAGEAARDTSGNGIDQNPDAPAPPHPYLASFRTRQENIPPRVRDLVFDAGPPVPITSRVRVVFNEAIDPGTVTAQSVRLLLGGSGIAAAVSLSAPDTALLVPTLPLLYDTTYTVTAAGLGDLHGNLLDQDPALPGPQAFARAFVTVPDLVPPRVIRIFPPADSSGVDPGVVLEVEFDEPVDSATVIVPSFALYHTDSGAQLRPGTISGIPGGRVFRYRPDAPLPPGGRFQVRVTNDVRDRRGNGLDQDPATPAADPFVSEFHTGTPPLAQAGDGVCDPATNVVTLAASADRPDTSLSLAEVNWGDGTGVETITIPSGQWPSPSHTYPCLDIRGCNLEDDDQDGSVDEPGPAGCDESYQIRLRVLDRSGLWSAWDPTGASFCNLQVRHWSPGAVTGVDTLLTEVRLRFTRPLLVGSVVAARFTLVDTADVSTSLATSVAVDTSSVVVLTLTAPLQPGMAYTLHALPGIQSAEGRVFDQDPCTSDVQSFEAVFQTQLRLPPLPPAPSPPPRAGSTAQEGRARSR
jgi:hypothetical protein